ncbi:hypothetical protein TWF696_009581 [Orbilia brochopaga]|uniref:Uncharacterized protein n=1 Tax=Orbilia brochopaga TaxID=3140254 RepID=A0AAV9UBX2_9PEZI
MKPTLSDSRLYMPAQLQPHQQPQIDPGPPPKKNGKAQPYLPSLPPPTKPGDDAVTALGYIWINPSVSYKTAKLLYLTLFQGLREVCPEIDWTKFEQWRACYSHRRRSGDFKSYLREDDVETFIDFMQQSFPINKFGERSSIADQLEYERRVAGYFERLDISRAKQPVKKKEEIPAASLLPLASSGATSPEQLEISGSTHEQSSSSADQTADQGYSSSITSADSTNNPLLIIPEKRRRVVSILVEDAIKRVTRSMLAIYRNMDRDDILYQPESRATGRSKFLNPEGSKIFSHLRAKVASEGNLLNLRRITRSPKYPSWLASAYQQTPGFFPPVPSGLPDGAPSRSVSSTISQNDRLAMKAYLEAQDAGGNGAKNGTFLLPHSHETSNGAQFTGSNHKSPSPVNSVAVSLYERQMEFPFYETSRPESPAVEPFTAEHDQIDQISHPATLTQDYQNISQPIPTSPSTQAQLQYMQNYSAYTAFDDMHIASDLGQEQLRPHSTTLQSSFQPPLDQDHSLQDSSYQQASYLPPSEPTPSYPPASWPPSRPTVSDSPTYPPESHPPSQQTGSHPLSSQQTIFYARPQQITYYTPEPQHTTFYAPQRTTFYTPDPHQTTFYTASQPTLFYAPASHSAPPQPTLQAAAPQSAPLSPPQDPAAFLNYLMEHGTPIGPDTTPHLAMFASQRRKKEREEQEALAQQYDSKWGL